MLQTELMCRAKASQEPSLLGQAPLAPSAGAADLLMCHRAGVAELGCSTLPTSDWDFPPQLPHLPPLLWRLIRVSHQQQGYREIGSKTWLLCTDTTVTEQRGSNLL